MRFRRLAAAGLSAAGFFSSGALVCLPTHSVYGPWIVSCPILLT